MGRISNQILGVEGLNAYKFNISEGVVKVNETEFLRVSKVQYQPDKWWEVLKDINRVTIRWSNTKILPTRTTRYKNCIADSKENY